MKTLFIGQNAIHLTIVDSTNSYASEMLRQIKPVEGTIIYTFEQKSGRGQRGNFWHSEPNKNVALSLILYPSFLPVNDQFLLTKMVSLAVADLMAEMLPGQASGVKIKWPNDIYVNDKKIAGILIENGIAQNIIQSSVIGIGLNINQVDFPEGLNACSLKLISGKEFRLQEVIEALCGFIEGRYLQMKANKHELSSNDYLRRLYRLNEWSNYSLFNEITEGRIKGVSASGKLQLELRSSEIKEFDLKEISFLP
jgi:BirA family transcriptional regulator, biotin operon repressor / biotin---[acetyl-CoA-carboxylase] ligase